MKMIIVSKGSHVFCLASPALRLLSVSAGYPGRPVLDRLTADIPRGAVTALVGANGSGKSTLLGVLAGTIRPSSGRVERAHGRRPAFVVQRSAADDRLPLTVRDAVTMGRWALRGAWRPLTRADRRAVDAHLDALDLTDLAGLRLGDLSGGQRQRTLLAQALAQESDLLLLDEPAAALDTASSTALEAALTAATARGTTIVHATHDPAAAARAPHRLLLTHAHLTPDPKS